MKLDTLDALEDADLRAIINRSEELLKLRDEDRKSKALSDARTLLAAAGLSLKDVASRGKGARHAKGAPYHAGTLYQHPSNKALVWNAKGQKPGWLRELEGQGVKPVAVAESAVSEAAPVTSKKTA
jgi:DNA-binding protein H-NS